MKPILHPSKKLLLTALITLMAVLLFAGCGTDQVSEKEENGGITIFVGGTLFESSLDPVKGGMAYGYPFTNNGLIKVSPDSKYVGDLAEDWEVSEDALTYTFHLKEGIKFHDGTDFTAADVVFTYDTVKENQGENENVDLSNLKKAEAIDDTTVIFTLSESYSSFLDQTALLGIVPGDGYDSEAFDTGPVGTGPWEVVQFDTSQKIMAKANEDYFDGAPSIPRVTILNMDNETAIANAKSGELDVVMVDANYSDEKIDGMKIERLETMDVRQISLPVTNEQKYTKEDGKTITVGNDVTAHFPVRKALAIGIDRQNITDNALSGVGKPAEGFTDNLKWGNPPKYEDNRKDEARKLLEGAGWKKGEDGIYERGGQKCRFTVMAPSGDNERYQLAAAVAEEAKLIGIKIDIEQRTWDEISNLSRSNGVVWGWGQFDPVVLRNLFHTGSAGGDGFGNTVGYSNKKVDRLIDEALTMRDRKDVTAKWKEVQRATADDCAYLYVVNIEHSYFVKDTLDISIDTQIPHPHGHGVPAINNMKDWKLNLKGHGVE